MSAMIPRMHTPYDAEECAVEGHSWNGFKRNQWEYVRTCQNCGLRVVEDIDTD